MGRLDEVTFRYRMSDGLDGVTFLTHDFDGLRELYVVTATGRLIRPRRGENTERLLGDMNFSGMLNLRYANKYALEFVEGTLVAIHCDVLTGRLIFDPAQCVDR